MYFSCTARGRQRREEGVFTELIVHGVLALGMGRKAKSSQPKDPVDLTGRTGSTHHRLILVRGTPTRHNKRVPNLDSFLFGLLYGGLKEASVSLVATLSPMVVSIPFAPVKGMNQKTLPMSCR